MQSHAADVSTCRKRITQIIGQRVGTARRSIGMYQQETTAELAHPTGKLRAIKLTAATHRAAYLDEHAQCSELHALHLRWGRRFMEPPQKLITASAWVADKGQLGCRLVSGVHRAALLGADKPRGQTRRKDFNLGSKYWFE